MLDAHLASRAHVVGDSLTIADLTLASSLMYAEASETPLAEFGNVSAWFGRMTELPAWKQTSS